MLAIQPARPETAVPVLGESPAPVPRRGEVLVEVAAAGVNHADLFQLQGQYPPPPGESEIPGLELAGKIVELGPTPEGCAGWKTGDRVMALVGGGGHGQLAAVPVGQLMPLPEELDFVAGGALPEAGLTAWVNLVTEGALQAGETVLISGATGGMGTFFVQLAHALGARVFATGRNTGGLGRLERLRALGADEVWTDDEDLAARCREATAGKGVDLVTDLVGGAGLGRRLSLLRSQGRLVLIGLTAGRRVDLDLSLILHRRLRVVGSVLRPRSREEKARLTREFAAFALPRLRSGELAAVVERTYPFSEAAAAYAALRQSGLFGKLVLGW
jgi:putative PIG3 family NAD(P)H quinone oxidoreductase